MSIERRRNAGNQNTDKSWLIIYTCENKIAASRSRSLRSKRASGVHSVNKQLSAGSSWIRRNPVSFLVYHGINGRNAVERVTRFERELERKWKWETRVNQRMAR